MKKSLLFLTISASLLCCCTSNKKEKTNTDQLMFQLDSTDNHSGIQQMQASTINQPISVNGKAYTLYINRTPSDSLPIVKCETGSFNDNKIVVRITNSTNNIVFSKTFTKSTFSEYLPDDFKKSAILEGIVFDAEKSELNKTITIAASISFPMSDLYIPFTIKIANGSIISISKDEDLDDAPTEE